MLKLTFRNYPAIHTNYIISNCNTLQYNHNIIFVLCHDTYAEKNVKPEK